MKKRNRALLFYGFCSLLHPTAKSIKISLARLLEMPSETSQRGPPALYSESLALVEWPRGFMVRKLDLGSMKPKQ
ncbi:MAG: hypothetical protein ACFUZC_10815 [Chthoniobacteraceae bacterium]